MYLAGWGQRRDMLPALFNRIKGLINCNAIRNFRIHMTGMGGKMSVRYIMEVISVDAVTNRLWEGQIEPRDLAEPVCYYLGTYPIYFEKKGKIPVYPHHLDPLAVVELRDTTVMRGGNVSDYEWNIINGIRETQDYDTLQNMLDKEGKYDPQKLLDMGKDVYQIDELTAAMNELTMFRTADRIQDYFLMDYVLQRWKDVHQKCLEANYPKEAKPRKKYYPQTWIPQPKKPQPAPTVKLPSPSRLGGWPKDETETVLELLLELTIIEIGTTIVFHANCDIHIKPKIF